MNSVISVDPVTPKEPAIPARSVLPANTGIRKNLSPRKHGSGIQSIPIRFENCGKYLNESLDLKNISFQKEILLISF